MSLDPAAWGIDPGYHDIAGVWHDSSPESVRAVLEAMGAHRPRPPGCDGDDDPVWVVTVGSEVAVDGEWQVTLEDGTTFGAHASLVDLPLGYHDLVRSSDGRQVRLIVCPPRCFLPEGLRTWGWGVQLYALRSAASWGIGDLGDLRELAAWSARSGAGTVLVNPLHASLVDLPQQPSPYFPSSRCFRNPLYIRVDEVAGAGESALAQRCGREARALNDLRLIQRDRVWSLKMAALEEIWRSTGGALADRPELRRYRQEIGPSLSGYATFCALSQAHGRGWRAWPVGLRRPEGPEVARFAVEHREGIAFHEWLQWLLDEQLGLAAGAGVALCHDLAIGTDPCGADAWLWQDSMAGDVSVGAPPDEFNRLGQDWAFSPFDPWRLRAERFEPFIAVVRSALRHAGGLRIDHIAGLFRLFWIPRGAQATDGVYVRYPWEELLGVLALESVRARAWVVGEDLGTVEPIVGAAMERRDVLSMKLLWFERDPPERYPERAMAAVTTHDLPTVVGLWSGSDLAEQHALGLAPNDASTAAICARLEAWIGEPDTADPGELVTATHRLLARAPSAVLVATLDDALGVAERPNVPGTTNERPNWCIALPRPAEELPGDPLVQSVIASLSRDAPAPA
jgi:4-alpha-glucanotransferase